MVGGGEERYWIDVGTDVVLHNKGGAREGEEVIKSWRSSQITRAEPEVPPLLFAMDQPKRTVR
jgi:hypothetical protein